MRYRYWRSGDREFRYYSTALTACPYKDGPPAFLADEATRIGLDLLRAWPKTVYHRAPDKGSPLYPAGHCKACGAKVEKLGYRAEVARIEGLFAFIEKDVMLDLRREAREWAYEEFRAYKSAAAEAS